MKQPISISGLSETIDLFDAYFIDQFGVLHDGEKPYLGVVETLERLYHAGKKLIVLTNSGRRAAPNLQRLVDMGIPKHIIEAVVSSGEVAWRGIRSGGFGFPFIPGCKGHIIGREGEYYGFDDLGLRFVEAPETADFLMISGSNAPKTSLEDYAVQLSGAAKKSIPALCANPDILMLTGGGLEPAPGAIAETYRKLGGEVRYIGKPYSAIYQLALDSCPGINMNRVIAVGDSVEHDIRGAADFGIASVLVRTGVLTNSAPDDLANIFAHEGVWPTYVSPSFGW